MTAAKDHAELNAVLDEVDLRIGELETLLAAGGTLPLAPTVEHAMRLINRMIIAYIKDAGDKARVPEETEDILEVWKVLVKGDPSWNTIRDNCRELVYYKNCIAMQREDALPKVPDRMTVRTLRHIHLFIKTRCLREGRLAA